MCIITLERFYNLRPKPGKFGLGACLILGKIWKSEGNSIQYLTASAGVFAGLSLVGWLVLGAAEGQAFGVYTFDC